MSEPTKGPIAWFVANPVAANLLMAFLLIAGYLSVAGIPKELLPRAESKVISFSMSYPGASPSEVQEGIVLKVEEAIQDIQGIKHVQSVSSLGSANIRITAYDNQDVNELVEELRMTINSIRTFPEHVDPPNIQRTRYTELAMQVQLHGQLDERMAKLLAEEIKREMLARERIKRVAIWGARPYEIAVEIDNEQLQKYRLTLQDVANRIQAQSINAPSGGIKTETGNIMLRVDGQSYNRADYENISIITADDGTVVSLGDIARVNDGFVEWKAYSYFNGEYSVGLAVSAVGDQDVLDVAREVRRYVNQKRKTLPDGVEITIWADITHYLDGRLRMMVKNLLIGATLVFIILSVFMPLKIAFWVMVGLPVCYMGTFLLMPWFGVSFNMISLFGFILVLGIIVDDAIIVAESIDGQIRKSGPGQASVLEGTKRVATPAIFGVLTTIVAFAPMLLAQGPLQSWLHAIGFIVCACLVFSLIESKLILPAHLGAMSKPWSWGIFGLQYRLQQSANQHLQSGVKKYYAPLLQSCIKNRYLTLSFFIAVLMICFSMVKAGIVSYEPFPSEPSDFLQVRLSMGEGTAEEETEAVMSYIRDELYALEEEYMAEYGTETGLVENLFRYGSGGLNGHFFVELVRDENRYIDSFEIVERWRNRVGEVEGASVLDFTASTFAGSRDLSFMLTGNNKQALELAAEELLEELRSFDGLSNFSSTIESARQEYLLDLKPQAAAMGLTLADIAVQVRQAFHGVEAQRIQRDNQEIRVMVRYPEERRASVLDLETMQIKLPGGRFVPLEEVADITFVMSPVRITRVNNETAVYVGAKVDRAVSEPGSIRRDVMRNFMPKLQERYPSVQYRREGINQEQRETEQQLQRFFLIAMLGIFILLAVPLKSYVQPFIIMSVIPVGIVGAVIGHWLLGFSISFMSLFGIVALTGVVVNDSLIMVDFVNRSVREGMSKAVAVLEAGQQRFRAIILTTITTFFGVLPMIMERSLQAENMIPMAISLGVGVVFATAITLLLLPCLYMVLEDIKTLIDRLAGKHQPAA